MFHQRWINTIRSQPARLCPAGFLFGCAAGLGLAVCSMSSARLVNLRGFAAVQRLWQARRAGPS